MRSVIKKTKTKGKRRSGKVAKNQMFGKSKNSKFNQSMMHIKR